MAPGSGLLAQKMKKKRPLSAIRRDLDKAFSAYIRKRDADENGMGRCITCYRWAKLECGHFIPRQHIATRWSETNCAGQCSFCNRWQHGAQAEFYVILVKMYGEKTVNELMASKHKTMKFTRSQLEEMLERYRT